VAPWFEDLHEPPAFFLLAPLVARALAAAKHGEGACKGRMSRDGNL
jgi:hypothetical protein